MALKKSALSVRDAIGLAYHSYNRVKPIMQGPDRLIRHPEWTRRVLNLLGAPDAGRFNIAITGSKGKGSHSILLAGILQRLGLRVGLFTGPHLVDFMERFRVDGETIPEEDFVRLMTQVYEVSSGIQLPDEQYIGPVGLLACVASLWFKECDTDVNIYELGRGALHDDVNQVVHQGAVLTPVFTEHVLQLGPTLADIAEEKLGILTETTNWLVSHRQSERVDTDMREKVAKERMRLDVVDDTVAYQLEEANDGRCVMVRVTVDGEIHEVLLPSEVRWFASNVAASLTAAKRALAGLHPEQVLPAFLDLGDIRLPGRLHVIRESPLTLVDGTIHADSARYVVDWVQGKLREKGPTRVGAVIGIPSDKDGAGVVRTLQSVVDFMVFTRAHNPHLDFDNTWADEAAVLGVDTSEARYLEDAVEMAQTRLRSQDILLILGTQSLVGDALRLFSVNSTSIWSKMRPL